MFIRSVALTALLLGKLVSAMDNDSIFSNYPGVIIVSTDDPVSDTDAVQEDIDYDDKFSILMAEKSPHYRNYPQDFDDRFHQVIIKKPSSGNKLSPTFISQKNDMLPDSDLHEDDVPNDKIGSLRPRVNRIFATKPETSDDDPYAVYFDGDDYKFIHRSLLFNERTISKDFDNEEDDILETSSAILDDHLSKDATGEILGENASKSKKLVRKPPPGDKDALSDPVIEGNSENITSKLQASESISEDNTIEDKEAESIRKTLANAKPYKFKPQNPSSLRFFVKNNLDSTQDISQKIANKFKDINHQKKTFKENNHLDFLLNSAKDFNTRNGINTVLYSKRFGKLPAFDSDRTNLEKLIASELYYFTKLKDLNIPSKILKSLIPGEYRSFYKAIEKGEEPKINRESPELANLIEDEIFGLLSPPSLVNNNVLQRRLYSEYICKETLISEGIADHNIIQKIHVGSYCVKTVSILLANENETDALSVYLRIRRKENPETFVDDMVKYYLFGGQKPTF